MNVTPTNSKISDADSSFAPEVGAGGGGDGEVNGGGASEDPAAMPRPVSAGATRPIYTGESTQRPISVAVDR